MGELDRVLNLKGGGGEKLSFAPASKKDDEDEGGGIFDILGDVATGTVRGVRDIGLGVLGVANTAAHDALALGHNALVDPTGTDNDWDYKLDEVAKGLLFDWESDDKDFGERISPAIQQHMVESYGAVNPLDFEKDVALNTLRHDPLSPVLDIASVLTAGAGAVAKGAGLAGKVPRIARGLDDLAAGGQAGAAARAVDRILPGLKSQRQGLDVPLGGERHLISQGRKTDILKDYSTNPYRRMQQKLRDKHRTEGIESIQGRIADLDSRLASRGPGDPQTQWIAEKAELESAVARSIETGAAILSPKHSEKLYRRTMSRIIGQESSDFIKPRNEVIARAKEISSRFSKEVHHTLYRYLNGFEPRGGPGRMPFDEIEATLGDTQFLGSSSRLAEAGTWASEHIPTIRKMEADSFDPVALEQSRVGQRVWNQFEDELRETGYFTERRAGIGESNRSLLDPDTEAQLQERMVVAAQDEIDAAKRFTEIVAGEPLASARSGHADDIGDAMDDYRLLNATTAARARLESGGSYAELFNRLYLPLRVKAGIEAGAKPGRWEDAAPTAKVLDDAVRAGRIKAPVYFPHVETLNFKGARHLLKYRRTGMGKASDPKLFKHSTGSVVERHLRNITDAMKTDPDEVYAIMASEIAGYEQTLSMIARIKDTLGRRVKTGEDFNPKAEVLINPNAVRVAARRNLAVVNHTGHELIEGKPLGEAFENGLRAAFGDMDADTRDLLARRGELFAIPKAAADVMDSVQRYSFGGKKSRLFIEGPINVWRAGVLYLRPGFFTSMTLGNFVFGALQGSKFRGVLQQLDKRWMKKVREVSDELDITDQIEQGGLFGEAQMSATHLGPAADTRTGKMIQRYQSSLPGRTGHKAVNLGQRLASVIEDSARRESFLTAAEKHLARRNIKRVGNRFIRSQKRLEQIMEYGVKHPKAVQQWLDEMNDTLFDYRGGLSPFERKVVRRFIAPFYSFYRHSSRLLVTMPIEHPLKGNVLSQLGEIGRELNEDEPWLDAAVDSPLGKINLTGGNPFNIVGDPDTEGGPIGALLEPLAQQLGPQITVPLEQATGLDFFRGDRFSAPGVGPFDDEKPRPDLLEHLGQQFPAYDLLRDLLPGAGARYGTGETITNPDGTPRYPADRALEALKYLGLSIYDRD